LAFIHHKEDDDMRIGLLSLAIIFTWGCASQPANTQNHHAADARLALAMAYLEQGNLTKARDNLFRAQDYGPTYLPTLNALAHYYVLVDNVQKSEVIYTQALSLYPNHPDLLNNYGVLLCKEKRFDEADHYFHQAISTDGYGKIAESFENAALCCISNQQLQKAQRYLIEGLTYAPLDISMLAELTKIDIELGDTEQAKQHLQQLQVLSHHSPELRSLTMTLAQQLHQSINFSN
jgi:type IV pilus assembly protein PilF